MVNKRSLQDLQRSGGLNLTPKDERYLKLYVLGRFNLSSGEKLRYLIKRGYMNKDKTWSHLGNAALKAVRRDTERKQARQKEERKIDRCRSKTTGGRGDTS